MDTGMDTGDTCEVIKGFVRLLNYVSRTRFTQLQAHLLRAHGLIKLDSLWFRVNPKQQ